MKPEVLDGPLLPRWPNFRDLGGVAAANGRRVRRGRFFRSPALSGLHPAEEERLRALDPALVVDFRSPGEIPAAAIELAPPLADRRLHIAIPPLVNAGHQALFAADDLRREDVVAAMEECYREFARAHHAAYARFLAATRDAGDRAVIFHCTAGKDRTGFAAALILAALGAPAEEVERDYLATARLWRPDANLAAIVPEAARAAVFGVEPCYLRAALDELNARHGGPARFAETALGGPDAYRDWLARHTI